MFCFWRRVLEALDVSVFLVFKCFQSSADERFVLNETSFIAQIGEVFIRGFTGKNMQGSFFFSVSVVCIKNRAL